MPWFLVSHAFISRSQVNYITLLHVIWEIVGVECNDILISIGRAMHLPPSIDAYRFVNDGGIFATKRYHSSEICERSCFTHYITYFAPNQTYLSSSLNK